MQQSFVDEEAGDRSMGTAFDETEDRRERFLAVWESITCSASSPDQIPANPMA
jgi:hypothetical protein